MLRNYKRLYELSRKAGEMLREKGMSLSLAESCTGGLISALITEIPGSSDYFEGSVVSYSNKVKEKLLGVSEEVLKEHGAVSEPCASEMAKGVRKRLKTSVSLSVTGIAGPAGGSLQKPVGTVFISVSGEKRTMVRQFHFKGMRGEIREQTADAALTMLTEFLEGMN